MRFLFGIVFREHRAGLGGDQYLLGKLAHANLPTRLLAGVGPLRKLSRHRSNRLHLQTSAVSTSGSCYWAAATDMGMFSPCFAFRSTAPAASTDRSGGYESLSKMQPVVVTAFLPKTTRPGSVFCCRQNRARGSE
jgi:hypothetical protein